MCRKLAAAFAGQKPQGRDLAWDFFVRQTPLDADMSYLMTGLRMG